MGITTDEQDPVSKWSHGITTEGTGSGLAIVAEIVDARGWGIDVCEAAPGGPGGTHRPAAGSRQNRSGDDLRI
jgi:signal transduction histidine kinase